jgi:hypothetical protein
MLEKLTNDNYIIYAMKHYDNPQCHTLSEFEEDLNKLVYLQRSLSKYKDTNEINERLVLNHIIILFNLFNEATINILFYKIRPEYWNIIITFLIFLERMPESLPNYGIITSDYQLDQFIITKLRNI